jgi:hypothetical protein
VQGDDVTQHLTKLKRHPMFENTRFRLYCLAAARSVLLGQDWMGEGQVERGRRAEGQGVCAGERELGLVREFDVPAAVLPQGAVRDGFTSRVSPPLQLLRSYLIALVLTQTGRAPAEGQVLQPGQVEEEKRLSKAQTIVDACGITADAYIRWWALCAANAHGLRMRNLDLELVCHVISCTKPCSPSSVRQETVRRIVESVGADFSPRCCAALFRTLSKLNHDCRPNVVCSSLSAHQLPHAHQLPATVPPHAQLCRQACAGGGPEVLDAFSDAFRGIVMVAKAARDVNVGEELTIDYLASDLQGPEESSHWAQGEGHDVGAGVGQGGATTGWRRQELGRRLELRQRYPPSGPNSLFLERQRDRERERARESKSESASACARARELGKGIGPKS